MSAQKLAKDLTSILDELDSTNLDNLTETELLEYRKQLNCYGRTIEGSNSYLTFSFTNLSEKYSEKLLMTGMIGFLNAECDAYMVPQGHKIVPVYDYVRNPSLIDEYSKDWTKTEKIQQELDENKMMMYKRIVIKEFLETIFQYNPDVHVRSAYKPQPKDIARNIIDTPAANLAMNQMKKTDVKFREQMLEYDRIQKMLAMKEGSIEKIDAVIEKLVAKKLVMPAVHYMNVDYASMDKEDKNLLRTTCSMIPPVDTFHKYRTYFETNYDKLREAVLYLYCEKPDFDAAINPYSWHETRAEAEAFQKKHKGEVITDIIIADSGKWNMHAPFSKVRETMKYFNENTIVLEEIASQIEKDAKMGEELMKNRVKQQKKKNIEEEGPDSELFSTWKESNATLKDMGAMTLNKDSFADENIPDDSIQVDVFRISDGKFGKEHFFTKAVAPTSGSAEEQ